VKLSGRPQASDWSCGRILSPRAGSETTERHGPLQRLLGASIKLMSYLASNEMTCWITKSEYLPK